jgi:isochorismate hydrolase
MTQLLLGDDRGRVLLIVPRDHVDHANTAREVYMHDYYLVFVSDCTATMSQEAHDYTLKMIDTYFGQVAGSDDIMSAWGVTAVPAQVGGRAAR